MSIAGRLAPNYLADRVGPLNLLAPTCLSAGVCLLSWIAVRTPVGLYVWAAAVSHPRVFFFTPFSAQFRPVPSRGTPTTLCPGLSWAALPPPQTPLHRGVPGSRVSNVLTNGQYGIAAGGIQSLFPAGLGALTPDARRRGARMGMAFSIVSFAALGGNPIAGRLVAAARGRYWAAQLFTGACLLVGMALVLAARAARRRRTGGGWLFKI